MIEISSPAGNISMLKGAIDSGADSVYLGFNSSTNMRNFPGLNLTYNEVKEGIEYAHKKNKKVYVTINTLPTWKEWEISKNDIDKSYELGADAVIVSDISLLNYIKERYPDIRIHLSVQAGASNYLDINFYKERFDIKRVVLPRSLNIEDIKYTRDNTDVELEIFGIGLLCINYEGRCMLSSYLTGKSVNTSGLCSPPEYLSIESGMVKLGNRVLRKGMLLSYPTPCKGFYSAIDINDNIIQTPESLSIINILPIIMDIGIDAIKIEGRQRSLKYVKMTTKYLKKAIDNYRKGKQTLNRYNKKIIPFLEGMRSTYSPYIEE
jgi:putative protease